MHLAALKPSTHSASHRPTSGAAFLRAGTSWSRTSRTGRLRPALREKMLVLYPTSISSQPRVPGEYGTHLGAMWILNYLTKGLPWGMCLLGNMFCMFNSYGSKAACNKFILKLVTFIFYIIGRSSRLFVMIKVEYFVRKRVSIYNYIICSIQNNIYVSPLHNV